MTYIAQSTVQYKTFVKRALVEAVQAALADHPDPTVVNAKVDVDFTKDDFKLPAVIIKFFEQDLPNAGVGHFEWFPVPLDSDSTTTLLTYQHRIYKGDIEFEIYGEESPDRDILADALVEVFAMIEVSGPGLNFIQRFYDGLQSTPYGLWHFATLNTDDIKGYGETMALAPWMAEDLWVYQTAYRVPIFGEFYSYTPPQPMAVGPIVEVDVYGYPVENDNRTPIDPKFPAPPVIPSQTQAPAYQRDVGEPPGEQTI